ncbi:carotenoid oxygenase [Mucor mucedo]|uniref:carotenoid oxygenase n=1 Tax=Mucor mucedo TaxID=29922 RepID=UPI002221238E|nr:carotenoid oxygenase [Mucor mucedo]KAI7893569.1 carotenoid oxygenase [Mucor mucedo]
MIIAAALVLIPGISVYFLYLNYNNVYKKYQAIFQSYQLTDTPETEEPIILQLTNGEVPSWLNGIMYRIGPGKFNIKQNDGSTFSIKHAFDGLPFMHRFQIDGSAQTLKYNSRCLSKSIEKKIEQKSYKGIIFFGHVPVVSFLQWIYHFLNRLDSFILRPRPDESPDAHSVGVTATPNFPLPSHWKSAGRQQPVLVSKTDANILQKINAETLVPEKVFNYTTFDKRLKGEFSAAHHQYDSETKEAFNFTLSFAPRPRMIVFSTSDSGNVTILADITHRMDKSRIGAPYIHSFWLTKNYIIIPESPLTYHDKCLNMLLNGSVLSSMAWQDDTPTYFHIVSRKGGLVASIPVPPFYTFHVANSFDSIDPVTGDTILTLDSASFSDGDILNQLHTFGTGHPKSIALKPEPFTRFHGMAYPPARQAKFGDLQRYKLNLTKSEHISTNLLCKNVEFPRFNQKFALQSNSQFIFGCELFAYTEKTDESSGLIKVDMLTGDRLRYGQEGYSCSEPIFVPNPQSSSEDDGVLLTLANNVDCCYLIIVNSVTMKELSRFKIGQFTAVTFHGSFVDHEFESININ